MQMLNTFPEQALERIGFETVREKLMGSCRTPMGKEQADELAPSASGVEVERLLRETSEALGLLRSGSALHISSLEDNREVLNMVRVEGYFLAPEQLRFTREALGAARGVSDFLERSDELAPLIYDLSRSLTILKDLEKRIDEVVDEHNEVKSSASPALKSIRKRLQQRRSELRSKIQQFMQRAKKDAMAAEDEPTIRNGRMVLPIKAEHKRHISGFIHDVSSSGQTVYLEPTDSLHLNNEIRELEGEERAEIERILKALSEDIRPHIDALITNLEVLGTLDLISAKARLTDSLDGIIPELSFDEVLELRNARNPILLFSKKKAEVVPLDLHLSSDEKLLLVTGPNAGGKSVALKTIGICLLLAQCGIGIPAREGSRLPLIPSLFIDLGDDQSIENDLSTFSSRLAWMKHVLTNLKKGSFVLIDEAGAGTDPEEGSALYRSFLDHVAASDGRAVVTTHHGHLKVYAHEHPCGVNASMEFDQEALAPTFRFQKGMPGSSYAFEIAQRMGLPESMIRQAREALGEKKDSMEQLISDLEMQHQRVVAMREALQREKSEVRRLHQSYEQKNKTLNSEKNKIREKALKEAERIIKGANKLVERTVEELRNSKADKADIKKARGKLKNVRESILKSEEEVQVQEKHYDEPISKDLKGKPEVGDHIRLKDGTSVGELVELNGQKAIVQMDGLRLTTKLNKLVKVQPAQLKAREKTIVVESSDPNPVLVSPSLDLRGFRGDQALTELEYYLDQAIRSGLKQTEIIHGKGNGILSKLVREYLETRDEVDSFGFAPADLGGFGCTVVKLK